MKSLIRKGRLFLVLTALLVLGASIASVVATGGETHVRQQENRPVPDSLPPVISQVKEVEVISATIEKQGQPEAVAAILVRNNSDKAVMAVALESGDKNNFSGLNLYGYQDSETPTTIIKPKSSMTIHWALKEILPDAPLRIAGAVYADGTEDGEATTLQTIRSQRARSRAALVAKEGGHPK